MSLDSLPGLPGLPGLSGFLALPGSVRINSGDTVEAGYELTQGGNHPATTVSLVSGANITADIICQGGNSYTLTIPLPAQTYSIPAGINSSVPSNNPSSPLVYQGSTTATPPTGSPACVGVVRLKPTSALLDYPKAAMATLEDLVS
jgi:hypothetical protein